MRDLEKFFQAHQYTAVAFGVVANFCAVAVALTVAIMSQRANRTRITALLYVSKMHHSILEGQPKPTYVTVLIRNKGPLPVQIPFSFFGWRLPFTRDGWRVNPWDYSASDEWVPQKKYPFEIKLRGSEIFFIAEKSVFQKSMIEIFKSLNWSQRLRARWLRAVAITDDGKIFRVKLDQTIRKELRALREGKTPAPDAAPVNPEQ